MGIKQKYLLSAVSPTLSVTIKETTIPNTVFVVTKIEQYTYTESTFSTDLIGRDAHRRFLTDLGVALRSIDPSCSLTIGT